MDDKTIFKIIIKRKHMSLTHDYFQNHIIFKYHI